MCKTFAILNSTFFILFLSCATTERSNPFDSQGENWSPPVVTAMADTTVSFITTTSVTVAVTAADTNSGGSIEKYYWDSGANGWDDSTDAGSYTVTTVSGGPVSVRWAARDDDGVFSYDTFTILFNRPPASASVTVPTTNESWVTFDWPTSKGSFPLTISATDPDGAADTMTYTLYTGPSAGSLTLTYSGRLTVDTLDNVYTSATVHYRLVARDIFGDSAVSTDTFVAPPPPPEGMVVITGGTFQMGSTTGSTDEQPVHSVTVSSFLMDTTEVTQKQYSDVMTAAYTGFTAPSWSSTYGVGDNNPAYYVNWYDGVLYCNARTKASGSTDTVYSYSSISGTPGNDCVLSGLSIDLSKNGYRLPTEAEWEYACRGETATDYYWGNNSIGDYSWYSSNSGRQTHPVAQKLPNAYGLYDMSGNVWEWCNDRYGSYSSGAATNPTGPSSGSGRVLRGGGWRDDASALLRSANRSSYGPDYEGDAHGFRVVVPAQ